MCIGISDNWGSGGLVVKDFAGLTPPGSTELELLTTVMG